MKTYEEMSEVVGSIIDVFEDFLESKGIKIENKERDDYSERVEDSELAIIFGSDYDKIGDELREILKNILKWKKEMEFVQNVNIKYVDVEI